MTKLISAAVAATVMLIASDGAHSEETSSPEPVVRLLLDNDTITVMESRLEPGARSVLQERPPRLLYYLSPGQRKYTDFDGKSDVHTIKAGEVEWREREMVEVKNTGQTEIRLLIIVPK